MAGAGSLPAKHGPSWSGRITLTLALLLLCHAGYSALEHISFLKSINRVSDGLTTDIIIEALIAMVLCFVGLVQVADPLHEIALDAELRKQTRDTFESRPSYRSFGHRGRHFGQVLAQSLSDTQS